jgi:hypothetical protein
MVGISRSRWRKSAGRIFCSMVKPCRADLFHLKTESSGNYVKSKIKNLA